MTKRELLFIEMFEEAVKKKWQSCPVSLEDVASELLITRGQLNRRVKTITGITAQQYLMNMRMRCAKYMLTQTDMTVLDIAINCGFTDLSSFSRAFHREFNISPTAYRRSVFA